ncbi:triacylglycerol lipase 2 isoform X2 [Dendrobium catenatum]|uniref:triacylglycerol lipase 2 isoform X2 n=1 Tax=Dendrobium catenatum TaxID=906689 RepID=UPI00109FB43C|nr:triacylglycerol lipase 2 isoform X2 [Dendrobium catenatum]
MAMRKSLLLLILLFSLELTVESSSWRRKELMSRRGATGITTKLRKYLSSDDGTCKSRVEIFGYPCENHSVTTKDGYMLSLQRIPGGRTGDSSKGNKGPVLLQHGLFMDGFAWLVNSPNQSLGYILADHGYDVWLANGRGTVYSLGHTSLSSSDSGTLTVLASVSEQNLVNRLRSAALLCPIAYLNQIPSLFMHAAARIYLGEQLYWLGIAQLNPTRSAVKTFLETVCLFTGFDCYDLLTLITGKNCCLNSSSVQLFLDHALQSTSTKNIVHLSQTMRSAMLTKYDYDDEAKNMAHYGQKTAPAYNMSRIPNDFPLFMSYGKEDLLADVNDVAHLLEIIDHHNRNNLTVQLLGDYAHMDFIMAENASQLVYQPLMDFFNRY